MNSNSARSLEQEAAEDVFFGQVVMIWARWFLIAAGAVFFLWTSERSTQLALGVVPIVALISINFYLHGRYLLERPSNPKLITAASLFDVALISAIVLLWGSGTGATGLASAFSSSTTPCCSLSRSSCRAGRRPSSRL